MSLVTRQSALPSPGRRGLTQRRDLRDATDKGKQCSKQLTPHAKCRSDMLMLMFLCMVQGFLIIFGCNVVFRVNAAC